MPEDFENTGKDVDTSAVTAENAEDSFEENDDSSEDDFDESFEESEKNNWEDDWNEDWNEPDTSESQPETSTDTVNVPDKQPDTSDDAVDVSDKQSDSEIIPYAGKVSGSSDETKELADGSVDHHDSSEPVFKMPEINPKPAEKPRRGLKGSHRPHHRIGKEDA